MSVYIHSLYIITRPKLIHASGGEIRFREERVSSPFTRLISDLKRRIFFVAAGVYDDDFCFETRTSLTGAAMCHDK